MSEAVSEAGTARAGDGRPAPARRADGRRPRPPRWRARPEWGLDAHVRLQAPGVLVAVARVAEVLRPHRARGRLRPEELRAAADLPRWRAEEHLAGRVLLRLLAAEALPGADPDLAIAREPGGRPWLPGRPGTAVSISHSGPYAAAAVAEGRSVGVDVQVPRTPSAGMLRRCCGPRAAARLGALPADRAAWEFARVWTVQEACVKAHGTGLSGAPWHVPVRPGRLAGTWQDLSWACLPWPGDARAPAAVGCAHGAAAASPAAGTAPSTDPPHRIGGSPCGPTPQHRAHWA